MKNSNFYVIFTCLSSAYHGHLTSLIDISPYKFRKLEGQKEWVHVVCTTFRNHFKPIIKAHRHISFFLA